MTEGVHAGMTERVNIVIPAKKHRHPGPRAGISQIGWLTQNNLINPISNNITSFTIIIQAPASKSHVVSKINKM
jgi:hypothetical protein